MMQDRKKYRPSYMAFIVFLVSSASLLILPHFNFSWQTTLLSYVPAHGENPSTSLPHVMPTTMLTPTAIPSFVLANDTFHRKSQPFWGSPTTGENWLGTADKMSSATFTISNNTGQIVGGQGLYTVHIEPASSNMEVLISGSLSRFQDTSLGAILRWTDDQDWYAAVINGSQLVIQKRTNGSPLASLGAVPFHAVGGLSYSLRFQINGNRLAAKVWQGDTEPGSWMVTATDTSFQSGDSGLYVVLQKGDIASIKEFTALGFIS